jgi:hypothetical protein
MFICGGRDYFKLTEHKGNMATVKLGSGKMAARSSGPAPALVAAAKLVRSPRAPVLCVSWREEGARIAAEFTVLAVAYHNGVSLW